MANEERPALAEDETMAGLYKISNLLSSHFCKRFHLLISLQFAANAYTFKDRREIAHRSDKGPPERRRVAKRVRLFASGRG